MFLIDLLLAFTMALLFTIIIAVGFGKPGSTTTYILLFMLILLATLAGGKWIVPLGVPVHGYYWFSFFIVGFIVSLIVLALLPALRPPRNMTKIQEENRREAMTILAFDFFFGITVLILAAIIAFSYM